MSPTKPDGSRGRLPGLRAARVALGLTQAEAAFRCGLDAKWFGKLERGRHDARGTTLERLCRGLGCSADKLLGMTGRGREDDG